MTIRTIFALNNNLILFFVFKVFFRVLYSNNFLVILKFPKHVSNDFEKKNWDISVLQCNNDTCCLS